MDGVLQSTEVDLLVPEIDFGNRIVYLPIRHHSPACAWHVGRIIHQLSPDAVLIEGPRDATPLIPFLTDKSARMPIAIYTTYVRRRTGELPNRFSAYYPFCDYSPELAAIQAANEVGAATEFIDLTFPEQVMSVSEYPDGKVQSLLDERHLTHSRFILSACQRIGARDSDDLWDHLYENGFRDMDSGKFMHNVLAYCALARAGYTDEMLAADGTSARESAMAYAVSQKQGRVVVVTGGFHTVALPTATPGMPKRVQADPNDALVVLTRYSFEQLDRLNGYASGMPSPEFYQRIWSGQNCDDIVVELGNEIRSDGGEVSTEDEISALAQAKRLAQLRGHHDLTREDLLDGVRSVFVKGSMDIEGVMVMARVRKLLVGQRIGVVSRDVGQPPIVRDFRESAERLKIRLDSMQYEESVLDLYRRTAHREVSRLFHRLRFLDVPFADWRRGPDFVLGKNLDRIQEVWQYRWTPATETALIEKALYGATLVDASVSLLMEHISKAGSDGKGRNAAVGTMLLLDACRMGLHKNTQDVLDRTRDMVAEDSSFVSLVRATMNLLLLDMSREPLEAHHLEGLQETAETAFSRACYLMPELASTPSAEERTAIDCMNAFAQVPGYLEDQTEQKNLLWNKLSQLADAVPGNPAIRGAACGLLYADGVMIASDLIQRLRGHLLGSRGVCMEGVSFLSGLLMTARSVLWQVPELIESISDLLEGWSEDEFVSQLPNLRLAFADLTPRECDRVANNVAEYLGVGHMRLSAKSEFSESDVLMGAEINRSVLETLEHDGLSEWVADN